MWRVSPGIVAYDADWQTPAITEKHAYRQLLSRGLSKDLPFLYLAFPWANLIDGINREAAVGRRLKPAIDALPQIKGYQRVATVCQHIRFMDWLDTFAEKGVTDVFATHAETTCLTTTNIVIHPFPLYPVNFPDVIYRSSLDAFMARPYRYSFVGAFNPKHYLTSARAAISELNDETDSVIHVKREWHYEQAVYGRQIHDRHPTETELEEQRNRELEYAQILGKTRFSLCPSGTGPNSIRLWESLEAGCIPVLISDRLALPGDPEIWREACVMVSETWQGIKAIPDLLREVERDSSLIQRKLAAVEYLRQRYGREDFVADIWELALHGGEPSHRRTAQFDEVEL